MTRERKNLNEIEVKLPAKLHENMCNRKALTELPRDLIIEILMRLPTKSLIWFKCVSKQWSSLTSSRDFCNSLFKVIGQQQRLYMSLLDAAEFKSIILSMSSTSPNNTRFVVDQDLSISGMEGFYLNVFRSLMCFPVREKVYIYNPSTKKLLTLPAIKPDITVEQGQTKTTRYYIGHDPVNDQYKIFCTIVVSWELFPNLKSEHWVFVLKAGGSWRKVVHLGNDHAPLFLGRAINGSVIHYMASLVNDTGVVVSFDVRSEELTIIPVPRAHGKVTMSMSANMTKAGLIEYGGKLAIFDHRYFLDEDRADLWVLEDAGKNEWSKQTLVLQPCQRHLVQGKCLIVKGTTKDGKVILAPLKMCSRFYILCYDLQRNDLRKVELEIKPHFWFGKKCYYDVNIMDESESFIYLET